MHLRLPAGPTPPQPLTQRGAATTAKPSTARQPPADLSARRSLQARTDGAGGDDAMLLLRWDRARRAAWPCVEAEARQYYRSSSAASSRSTRCAHGRSSGGELAAEWRTKSPARHLPPWTTERPGCALWHRIAEALRQGSTAVTAARRPCRCRAPTLSGRRCSRRAPSRRQVACRASLRRTAPRSDDGQSQTLAPTFAREEVGPPREDVL